MARHTVKLSDFDGGVVRNEICGSYGRGENKSIQCVTNITTGKVSFEVLASRKVICETIHLSSAVDVYNDSTM